MQNPFRCFNSSPEVIRLAVMMYIRYLLSLRQVEEALSNKPGWQGGATGIRLAGIVRVNRLEERRFGA